MSNFLFRIPILRSFLFQRKILRHYLNSDRFNGTGYSHYGFGPQDVSKLIKRRKVDLVRGDAHPNPNIKAHEADTVDDQIEKIEKDGLAGCLYPSRELLKKHVKIKDYANRPYTLKLALGEPQLTHKSFPVKYLEEFLNDPRYHFDVSDSHGSIYLKSDARKDGVSQEVYLERFGYGFDENKNRYICVFLWDLSTLEPDQQRYWSERELTSGSVNLHPAFYATSMLGNFPPGRSVFDAIIQEIRLINECLEQFGQPKLFKEEFDERPKEFNFLLRPTSKAYNDFVHCFDKMLSDNLNHKFFIFENDWVKSVEMKKEATTVQGEKIVKMKGTLTALQDWLLLNIELESPDAAMKYILAPLKNVRKLRQIPAHKINNDEYDDSFMKKQDALLFDVFNALWNIRLIFQNSPRRTNPLINSYDDF